MDPVCSILQFHTLDTDCIRSPKHALLVWQMFLMQLLCAVGVYGAISFGYLPTVESTAQSEMKLLVLNITSAAQSEMKLLVLNITSAAQNDMNEGMELGFQKIAGVISQLDTREP